MYDTVEPRFTATDPNVRRSPNIEKLFLVLPIYTPVYEYVILHAN